MTIKNLEFYSGFNQMEHAVYFRSEISEFIEISESGCLV